MSKHDEEESITFTWSEWLQFLGVGVLIGAGFIIGEVLVAAVVLFLKS